MTTKNRLSMEGHIKRLVVLTFILFSSIGLFGQERLTEHVLTSAKEKDTFESKIDDLHWLVGRWTGEGFGGQLEENWNPPMGGAMLGTFRVVKEGKPEFYELCLIVEEKGTLIYKVKHFNPDYTGWEEKEDYASFRLLKIEPNAAYFDGLTIMRKGNTITQYLAMKQRDGRHREEVLTFKIDEQPNHND